MVKAKTTAKKKRESEIRVRVNEDELRDFTARAETKGLSASAWLRMLGKKETEAAG